MADRVNVIYKGDDSINFKCQGIFKTNVKPGDVIEGIPQDVYEREMKQDVRYSLVVDRPLSSGKLKNKIDISTESEDK